MERHSKLLQTAGSRVDCQDLLDGSLPPDHSSRGASLAKTSNTAAAGTPLTKLGERWNTPVTLLQEIEGYYATYYSD